MLIWLTGWFYHFLCFIPPKFILHPHYLSISSNSSSHYPCSDFVFLSLTSTDFNSTLSSAFNSLALLFYHQLLPPSITSVSTHGLLNTAGGSFTVWCITNLLWELQQGSSFILPWLSSYLTPYRSYSKIALSFSSLPYFFFPTPSLSIQELASTEKIKIICYKFPVLPFSSSQNLLIPSPTFPPFSISDKEFPLLTKVNPSTSALDSISLHHLQHITSLTISLKSSTLLY